MATVERRQTIVTCCIERIEQSREARSKRRRTLRATVVLRSRQRVAALELQTVGQTSIRLQHQRVILRRDAVANLEDIAETVLGLRPR
jgi:hypothetical protein